MKTVITLAFAALLSIVLLLVGSYGLREYNAARDLERRVELLRQELGKADAAADNHAAVAIYSRLSPATPELQLRIVQRQWHIALELLQYMQRARSNVELQNRTDAYSAKLKTVLDEMIDRCGATLSDSAKLSPAVAWQLHNAAGSAEVLSALVMLETGQNVDKVQSVMREAISQYKAAIEAVDMAAVPPATRNIPRWNLEVLSGKENVQKFDVAVADVEKSRELKEDLEALIPEVGGYGPGEPVETIIKK